MKFVLLVVLAIAIFPADSRGFPDKPVKRDFAAYQEVHFPSDSNKINNEPGVHNVIHNTKNFPDGSVSNHSSTDGDLAMHTASLLFPNGSQGLNFSEVVQQSLQERKEGHEELLRATCNDRWWCRNKNLCNQYWYKKWCPKSCNLCPRGALIAIGGQYFTFSTKNVSWAVAKSTCISLNGRLAILANPQAFRTYAVNIYSGEEFWLGGSDISTEGTWTWINGQTFSGFPWGPGQPNGGSSQNCLEWGWGNKYYNDRDCNTARRYVCEHEV